jgi:hypothetical protein
MFGTYVKKNFSKREWDFYSQNPNYMKLSGQSYGIDGEIWAAFTAASESGNAPYGTQELDAEELRRYQLHCEALNIHPRPFTKSKESEKTTDEEMAKRMEGMAKLYDRLSVKVNLKK